MAERQKHGFEYEQRVIAENNVITDDKNSLVKEEGYTDKWDMYESIDSNKYPVSVKCIGFKSSIDFGDFRRQTNVNDDFILYVGFWKNKKDNIVEEYKVIISKENWQSYFGDKNIINEMLDEMKGISNDYSDDKKWKEFRNKYKQMYGSSVISLRFKRDHKSQKRIQCGITKKNFLDIILKNNTILKSR